jgi:hypothetical protein
MDRRRGKEFGEERHEMFGQERTSPQMASAGFARIARLAATYDASKRYAPMAL